MPDIETLSAAYDAATQATFDYWCTIKTRKPFNATEQLRPVPDSLWRAKEEAACDYFGALKLRHFPAIGKAQRRRTVPTQEQVKALLCDALDKDRRHAMLRDVWPEISTASECGEAAILSETAWQLWSIARDKLAKAQNQKRRERRQRKRREAGIIHHGYSPMRSL
jgi:hypothetical protein